LEGGTIFSMRTRLRDGMRRFAIERRDAREKRKDRSANCEEPEASLFFNL
jgi:hypothetical protein